MTKLSGLGTESTFGLSDFLVKVKAAGAGDVLVTLQNLLTAINGNSGVISALTLTSPYKFYVYRSAAQTASTPSIMLHDTKVFDTGSNVDVITNKGRFTAPVNGFYLFTGTGAFNTTSGSGLYSAFAKNGSQIIVGNSWISATGGPFGNNPSCTALLQLVAGDYVEHQVYGSGLGIVTGQNNTYFQGHFISAT